MLVLIAFLVLVGIVLPGAELLAGHTLNFNPRWQILPPEFWNFLAIGMGGYIGGRRSKRWLAPSGARTSVRTRAGPASKMPDKSLK